MVPTDLRYTKDHEWVRVEDDVATVGITSYAADQLGDIVFVELPSQGSSVEQFATFGVVESVHGGSVTVRVPSEHANHPMGEETRNANHPFGGRSITIATSELKAADVKALRPGSHIQLTFRRVGNAEPLIRSVRPVKESSAR